MIRGFDFKEFRVLFESRDRFSEVSTYGRKEGKEMKRVVIPLFEVRVDHPIGESLTTDTNTFEHTITGELMHNQMGIDDA